MPKTLAAIALAALVIVGCGGNDAAEAPAKTATPTPAATVDDAQVEQGIKDSLSTKLREGDEREVPE